MDFRGGFTLAEAQARPEPSRRTSKSERARFKTNKRNLSDKTRYGKASPEPCSATARVRNHTAATSAKAQAPAARERTNTPRPHSSRITSADRGQESAVSIFRVRKIAEDDAAIPSRAHHLLESRHTRGAQGVRGSALCCMLLLLLVCRPHVLEVEQDGEKFESVVFLSLCCASPSDAPCGVRGWKDRETCGQTNTKPLCVCV